MRVACRRSSRGIGAASARNCENPFFSRSASTLDSSAAIVGSLCANAESHWARAGSSSSSTWSRYALIDRHCSRVIGFIPLRSASLRTDEPPCLRRATRFWPGAILRSISRLCRPNTVFLHLNVSFRRACPRRRLNSTRRYWQECVMGSRRLISRNLSWSRIRFLNYQRG
jgi:hypothetical protein